MTCGPTVLAGEPHGSASIYRMGALSASSIPRVDVLKIELFPHRSRFGIGLNLFSLRYGNWGYSVTERTYDTWGNLVGEASSRAKSKLMSDVLPLSLMYTPYYWDTDDGEIGRFRVFYEYSTTWAIKEQANLPVTCAYGNDSLGNRITQDYGGVLDLGSGMRLKAGYVTIKRGTPECAVGEANKLYSFGALNINKWYAGIELLFGGKTRAGSDKESRLKETTDLLGKAASRAADAPFLFWGLIFEDLMTISNSNAKGMPE